MKLSIFWTSFQQLGVLAMITFKCLEEVKQQVVHTYLDSLKLVEISRKAENTLIIWKCQAIVNTFDGIENAQDSDMVSQ